MDKEKVRKFLIIGTVSATTGVILFANYQAQLQAPNLQTDYSGKLSVPQGACDPENSNGQAENMWQVVPRGTNFKLEATEFTNQGGIVVRTGGDEIGYDELGNIVLKSGMVVYTQTVSTGSDEDGRVALAYNLCGLPEDEHVNLDASSLQRHYAQLEARQIMTVSEPTTTTNELTTPTEITGTVGSQECVADTVIVRGTEYWVAAGYKGKLMQTSNGKKGIRTQMTLVGGKAKELKQNNRKVELCQLNGKINGVAAYVRKP